MWEFYHWYNIVTLGIVCNINTGKGYNVPDVIPTLRKEYRIFHRGDKLVFGRRSTQGKKYNSLCLVPPSTEKLLGIGAPRGYHSIIQEAIAASVSADTKSNYGTALRMLAACQESLNRNMSLPLSDQDVLCFVSFMANRNVLDSTISNYLSGIRLVLLSTGYECENLRTPVVKQVLKGIHNLRRDPQVKAQKKTRRAMTIEHLKLLGHALAKNSWSEYLKSAVWAVALLAFWGALRIGEVLCPLSGAFDEKSTLLVSDVSLSSEVTKLWIISPKKCSPTSDVVEVFPLQEKALDPIRAVMYFWKLREKVHGTRADLPLFLEEDGKNFTKKKLNKLLHELMDPFLTDERDKLTGHSFRGGLATLMEAAGMSEEDIKAWGRWSSEAFKRYCKEGRSRRKIFAKLYQYI